MSKDKIILHRLHCIYCNGMFHGALEFFEKEEERGRHFSGISWRIYYANMNFNGPVECDFRKQKRLYCCLYHKHKPILLNYYNLLILNFFALFPGQSKDLENLKDIYPVPN